MITPSGDRGRRVHLAASGPFVCVGAAVAYFVALATAWPTRPGLYMDETNFVNAALGGYRHQGFVTDRVGGVPTMIMPYIGALKSWLFAPVFKTFGVSVLSVRIPAIALGGVTLVVAYWATRRVVGRWPAVLLVAIMATAAPLALMTKVDWSPMVLAMLLKLVAMGCFFNLAISARVRWLWALLITMLVGVFNKQDFLWLVVGMALAAAVAFPRPLVELIRRRPLSVAAPVGAFGATMAAYGALAVRRNLGAGGTGQLQDPLPHLLSTWHLYVGTTMGSAVVGFFTGRPPEQAGWLQFLWVPTLACLGVLAVRRIRGPLPAAAALSAKVSVFASVLGVAVFFEIAATSQATGPQHVVALWPLQALVFVAAVTAVVRSGPPLRTTALTLGAVALGSLLVAEALATGNYLSLMVHPARLRPVFSVDLYEDAAFLRQHVAGVDLVVSAGWGPGTPLFSLACPDERQKYRDDLWPVLTASPPAAVPTVLRSVLGQRRVLVVAVPSPNDLPPSLQVGVAQLEADYLQAYPHNRAATVLTTGAYDVVYLGPGSLGAPTAPCAGRPGHSRG